MSKRIMTKFNAFIITFLVTWVSANTIMTEQNNITQQLESCMAVKSSLPMNHFGHPCHGVYSSNQSWLSWLAGNSGSAQAHFLDLIELLHRSSTRQSNLPHEQK